MTEQEQEEFQECEEKDEEELLAEAVDLMNQLAENRPSAVRAFLVGIVVDAVLLAILLAITGVIPGIRPVFLAALVVVIAHLALSVGVVVYRGGELEGADFEFVRLGPLYVVSYLLTEKEYSIELHTHKMDSIKMARNLGFDSSTAMVYHILMEAARKRELVTYPEVCEHLGFSIDVSDHKKRLNEILCGISREEHRNGNPMLSAVVVQKDDRKPGKRFFELASELGKHTADGKEEEFFEAECQQVYSKWAGEN